MGQRWSLKRDDYTFVWKKTTKKNLEKLHKHIEILIEEVNEQYLWNFSLKNPNETLKSIKQKLIEMKEPLIPKISGRGHRTTQVQKFYRKTTEYLEKLENYKEYLDSMNGRNSMSKTDPDATFMRMKEDHMGNGQLKPAYNLQVLVDGGYIVGSFASNDRTDYATMIPAIDHMHKHIPWQYPKYCADSGYDSQQNHEALEKKGIEDYIKPQLYERSKKRDYKIDIGRKENMIYDNKQDCFICHKGKKLKLKYIRPKKNQYGYEIVTHVYRCSRGCKSCSLRSKCMKKSNASYKQVQINHKLSDYQRKATELISSCKGKEIRVNRSIQAEGAFAQIKSNWSFKRFVRKGISGIHAEWDMMCMAMNVLHLGNRLSQDKVGNPFYYKIDPYSA